MRKTALTWLSLLALSACLAAPILHFLGRLTNERYKLVFLVSSVGWFVFATLRSRKS